MSQGWHQSALDAASRLIGAGIASVGTAATGISTYLEVLNPIMGFAASFIGIIVSCLLGILAWNNIKKSRLERQQLHLQNAVLMEKESVRLEKARSREAAGDPIRRAEDHG